MLIKKLCRPVFVLVVLSIFLVGCWDKIELENRGFVLSIGIDSYKAVEENKENNRFSLTMSMPNLEEIASESGGDEENKESKSVKKADDKTVTGAMHSIDSSSSKKLYFGHTKLAVLGVDILKDTELFKETIDSLERNNEISKKIIVMATKESASKILDTKVENEPMVGMFVSNYYKNNSNGESKAFRSDLATLIKDLRETGNAILPDIEVTEDKVKIGGAAVIKNLQLVDFINEKDTLGFLWIKDATKNTLVTIKDEDAFIPLRITESKSDLKFEEVDGNLKCYITTSVKGGIEEYKLLDNSLYDEEKIKKLIFLYENEINNEILNTAEIFQKELKVDGFGFKQNLRKYNYDLFLKYENNWEEAFCNIEILPFTEVKIVNTGTVK